MLPSRSLSYCGNGHHTLVLVSPKTNKELIREHTYIHIYVYLCVYIYLRGRELSSINWRSEHFPIPTPGTTSHRMVHIAIGGKVMQGLDSLWAWLAGLVALI